MKSVLIATDFIKDIDGSYKALEINTNIGFMFIDNENYLNSELFDSFLEQNNITNIEIITPKSKIPNVIDLESTGNTMNTIESVLLKRYSGTTIVVNINYVSSESVTVPQIDDNDNTLILRISYDTTALIDDTYCKDNYEFLKLMYDQDSNTIPKTYINDATYGFDMIGNNIRDNGDYPNFLIKERFPTINYNEFPKILKINTIEELNELKSNLNSNLILQEYIFNPTDTELGKLKTYRVISLLYGPNLEVLDLFEPFIHTNTLAFSETVDYQITKEIQTWEKPCYSQKYGLNNSASNRFTYHFDEGSKIILSDGSITTIDNINEGSVLKTLSFPDMPLNEILPESFLWEKPFDILEGGLDVTTTTVNHINSKIVPMWLINIQLTNGTQFIDVEHGKAIGKYQNDTNYQFKKLNTLSIGDSLLLFNNETNLIEESTITDIKYSYETQNVHTVDVEIIDAFLTLEEGTETPKYAILQHNLPQCVAVCCSSEPYDLYAYPQCFTGGNPGYCYSGFYEYCIEYGYGFPYACNACAPTCITCGQSKVFE